MIAITSLSVAGLTTWLAAANAERPGVSIALIVTCAAVWVVLAVAHLLRRHRLTRIELLLILLIASSALTAVGAFSGAPAEPAVCAVALTNIPLIAALLGGNRPVLIPSSAASLLGVVMITVRQVDSLGLALCGVVSISAASLAPAVYIVTQQRQLELAKEAAVQLSLHDPLTGLLNRRGMILNIERLLVESRMGSASIAAVVVDIDHFKRINDTYGHGRGDEALRLIAEVLRSVSRAGDVVVRLGGEELAWLALWDHQSALEAAERLRAAVAVLNIPGIDQRITVSAGVAVETTGEHGNLQARVEKLLDWADSALYEAKSSGRNRTVSAPAPTRPCTTAR